MLYDDGIHIKCCVNGDQERKCNFVLDIPQKKKKKIVECLSDTSGYCEKWCTTSF